MRVCLIIKNEYFIIMGALTLDINSSLSSMGTTNFIEIDERKCYLTRLDRTFKN